MIVCRDDHQRHLFDCGDAHSVMERAGLHPAFTNARQTDEIVLSCKSFRHESANRDRNHRAEVTDHGELVLLWPATKNISFAPAHRPLAPAELRLRNLK